MGKSVLEYRERVGLFCFDGPMYRDSEGSYCSITITERMLTRYLDICDRLYVLIRTFHSEKTAEELNMPVLANNRIIVVEMPNYYSIKGLLFRHQEYKRIANYVRQADFIFARMPSQTSNMVLHCVRRQKKKYMVEVGGCAWDSFWNHSFKGKILAPYMYLAERYYVSKADYASYVTKKFLQNRYPTRTKNQIACSNVYVSPNIEALKNRGKAYNEKIIIGTAANSVDVTYKGQDSVIKALVLLKNNNYFADIEYQIVGPGSGDYLRTVANNAGILNQVRFMGTLTKSEMEKWLDEVDIYIQPSKQEGLPRALIEAMSHGCYALGSSIAGIPELLAQRFLFKAGNYKQIAQKLNEYTFLSKSEKHEISRLNIRISSEYSEDILDMRRKSFFEDYQRDILS